MQEKIIKYSDTGRSEIMSIRKFKSLKRKIVKCSLVYDGLYLHGVWFKTEEDSGTYLATPISEEQLKKIIPEQEEKCYVSDPDMVDYFKNLNQKGLADLRFIKHV